VVAVLIDGHPNELVIEAADKEGAIAILREHYGSAGVISYPTPDGTEAHVRWSKVGTVRLISVDPHAG
jgi:hypothetical protein